MSADVSHNIGRWPKRRSRPSRPRPDRPATDLKADFELNARSWSEVEDAQPQQAAPGGALSDAQREQQLKQAMTRFVRNKNVPEELETLRYTLIAARVMSGMTAVEAAQRFGYANSTQLSLIESGVRTAPKDWRFLRQASQVYGVSTDFLLGLSPHTEFDAMVSRQHALMRKTEAIVNSVVGVFASALISFSEQEHLSRVELERIGQAGLDLEDSMDRLRNRGFDDFPGGAPLLAAVDGVVQAAKPARAKAKQFQSVDHYLAEMRAGRMPVIPWLTERYDQEHVRAEVLGQSMDPENA